MDPRELTLEQGESVQLGLVHAVLVFQHKHCLFRLPLLFNPSELSQPARTKQTRLRMIICKGLGARGITRKRTAPLYASNGPVASAAR